MKAISLFTSAGIGELLCAKAGVEIVVANELIQKRADCYSYLHSSSKMICGDIVDEKIQNELIEESQKNKCNLLIATPPCQGLSSVGKNKKQANFVIDPRNYLILSAFPIIDACDFDYILIENVPRFLEMFFPYKEKFSTLQEILNDKYGDIYNIEIKVLNAKDYGVAQSRPRAIIKLFKKKLKWSWPTEEKEITLEEAIGHLPSLRPGEKSGINLHEAKVQREGITESLSHTPSGKSALANKFYYPKKTNGERIKGFHNTYKRMVWDAPCPARTTYCGSVSSHNNVHPGRKQTDGTYSDPRALSLLETLIVSSIPEDTRFPDDATDTFIRTMIGEAVPPMLMYNVVKRIGK